MKGSNDKRLAPGALVGGYRIERKLGEGGVGAVYAAVEPSIMKRVAIKVLRRSIADDATSLARFRQEARAANVIAHPAIVDVIAIGELDDGAPYLVMSLLEGRSLREELDARGKLSPSEAWSIAREVAAALAAAHDAGIVHRDMKPDNVFLERFAIEGEVKPRPKILDFGIAKVIDEEGAAQSKLTATGSPIGTPPYMAPEQWWAEPVTPATDQYAFGVMLFEMIAGQRPFLAESFAELVQAHVSAKPPRLADSIADVPEAMEALVARALAKSASDRFPSMRALIEAGDRALGIEGPAPVDRVLIPSREDTVQAPAIVITPPPASPQEAPSPPSIVPIYGGGSGSASGPYAPTPPVLARPLRRYFGVHAAIMIIGMIALVAVGYAGNDRHNPREWFLIGGWGQFPIAACFLGGLIGLPLLARRRARTGKTSLLGFWIALIPALQGAFATYTGWHAIMRHLGDGGTSIHDYEIMSGGTYEANACRFLGFSLASLLALSLSSMPAVSGAVGATTTLSGALGVRRRESILAALSLAVLAITGALLRAPSAALIAGVGACVLAASALLPTVHTETAARDELERGLAGLLAVMLAAAAGVTRIEAREAALWADSPTRAERVAELVAAADERAATIPIAALSALVILGMEVLRASRLARFRVITRPRLRTAVLILVLSVGVILDVVQHGRFTDKRDALRVEIASQFALFARLDPPSVGASDNLRPRHEPHRATALQISRDAIAVNTKGVAKLTALASSEGAAHVAAELSRAIAQAAVDQKEPSEVDLSISIDREVKGAIVADLLAIARRSGARRVEILLTRGASPKLGGRAPEGTGVVLPRDFIALGIELADDGLAIDPSMRFEDLAWQLLAKDNELGGGLKIRTPVR